MENRNSYTIVGMFFIISLSAFAVFMWWMTSKDDTSANYRPYYIETTELPTGIKVDSGVKFIGVPAGSVSKIDFVKGNSTLIEITMMLRDDLPIKHDSKAGVEVQALSGVGTINIGRGDQNSSVFGKNERPVLSLEASLLAKLGNNAESIATKINNSLDKLDAFFTPENIEHFQSILTNFDIFTTQLANEQNIKNVTEIVTNLRNFTQDLNQSRPKELIANANLLIQNSNTFIKELSLLAHNLDASQKSIKERIQRGDFNIRDILTPALSDLSIALVEFKRTLKEFKGALYRLEDNPYEFFFKDTNYKEDDK